MNPVTQLPRLQAKVRSTRFCHFFAALTHLGFTIGSEIDPISSSNESFFALIVGYIGSP